MATAREFFEAGRLDEAIEALNSVLRSRPDDVQARAFLFELLCFAGNWDRADKQLDILASTDKDKRLGALQYRGAINAERTRQEKFEQSAASGSALAPELSGTWNGTPFRSIQDADPRIGARLEILAGANYMWLPLQYVELLEIQPPKRLRDLLWIPATLQTGPGFSETDLGQVFIPALSPFSWQHAEGEVRLGRISVWEGNEAGEEFPFGQKMLLVDGDELPLLELRTLTITQPDEA